MTTHVDHDQPARLGRRTFLGMAATAVVGAAVSGCGLTHAGTADTTDRVRPEKPVRPHDGVLLAYFSRAGENYWSGRRRGLRVKNTETLVELIAQRLDCDVHRIRPVEPYSDDHDATVARDVREQDDDARPAIADPLASMRYDTILLASPIWNVRPPIIMRTFTDHYDSAGRTVLPVVTYAVSGLGNAVQESAHACPSARIGRGLAVRGERVRDAGTDLDAWLRHAHLT